MHQTKSISKTKLSKTFNVVRQALKSYDDQGEGWKDEHREAMWCYDFEDFLAMGIALFDGITDFDERHRMRVLANEIEYDPEHNEIIKEAYREWLRPCENITKVLGSLTNRFGDVKNAKEFLSRCREARGILTEDSKFFISDTLVDMRDSAIDDLRMGSTFECSGS